MPNIFSTSSHLFQLATVQVLKVKSDACLGNQQEHDAYALTKCIQAAHTWARSSQSLCLCASLAGFYTFIPVPDVFLSPITPMLIVPSVFLPDEYLHGQSMCRAHQHKLKWVKSPLAQMKYVHQWLKVKIQELYITGITCKGQQQHATTTTTIAGRIRTGSTMYIYSNLFILCKA